VCFEQANLLAPHASDRRERYAVVFCRNLLIYFDRSTQMQAVAAAARLLRPGGFLFVGPSETAVVPRAQFVSARVPMAFAFRKQTSAHGEASAAADPPRRSRCQPPATPLSATPKRAQPVASARAAGPPSGPVPPAARPPGMDAALLLAEQGRFAEAASCCEEHVSRHGPSPQAFYVLGLVQDARGLTREADRCYRKALYLDPRHVDALMHLALLVQRRGDLPEAEVLRSRIRRLQVQGGA
jgi:chemotaxis protein methyltransferase WspC